MSFPRRWNWLRFFDKKMHQGALRELNYRAMSYSLIAGMVEGTPTIKHLVKRLKQDPFFWLDSDFLLSDDWPPGASYSRMITTISKTDALVAQAIQEG